MTSAYWLFSFTYYTYCQGTRDRNYGHSLLSFTSPCDKHTASKNLILLLELENIEFEENSIKCVTNLINNS